MAYTFNGSTKIISFDSSTTSFDVRDLWSRWNDWLIVSDNSKYQMAMRVVGGDPLPGSKELGLTYFMMNGWKIKPYEENHTLTINGNLYSEDGSSPFMSVYGNYNVTIINTVSNLVDSTVQQLPEIEYASFQNKVAIDIDNGSAGTEYPLGTLNNPVNNLSDALIIANTRGFRNLFLLSDLNIETGVNIDNYVIEGKNYEVVTVESGVFQENTVYKSVSLYGAMGAFWNILIDCWVYDIVEFSGWLRGGSIEKVALSEYAANGGDYGGLNYFDDIVPMYPGVTSTIIGNTNVQVSFTNCKDIVTLKSATDGSIFNVGLREGRLIVDSSCIGGEIKVVGLGAITNNSLVTVNSSELVNPENITDKVWDEIILDHTTTGTTGKSLSTASSGGVDLDALATAVWGKELETSYSAEEILKILAGVLAGVTIGADTNTMRFRDLNNTKDRIIATLDGSGNRTMVAKDVS